MIAGESGFVRNVATLVEMSNMYSLDSFQLCASA